MQLILHIVLLKNNYSIINIIFCANFNVTLILNVILYFYTFFHIFLRFKNATLNIFETITVTSKSATSLMLIVNHRQSRFFKVNSYMYTWQDYNKQVIMFGYASIPLVSLLLWLLNLTKFYDYCQVRYRDTLNTILLVLLRVR